MSPTLTAVLVGLVVLLSGAVAVVALLMAARALTTVNALRRDLAALARPARHEQVAWARGVIAACHGAEMALDHHRGELHADLALAEYRSQAARGRALLRALGEQL